MSKIFYEVTNFMLIIIPYFAEVIAADMPDRLRSLRFSAIKEVQRYLQHYQKLGYMPKLLCAIAEKKCTFIMEAVTKADMERIMKPQCPHYNGNEFIPDKYNIPEEEMICWSETSLRAPLNQAGVQRYMELFRQVFPEESKLVLSERRCSANG